MFKHLKGHCWVALKIHCYTVHLRFSFYISSASYCCEVLNAPTNIFGDKGNEVQIVLNEKLRDVRVG